MSVNRYNVMVKDILIGPSGTRYVICELNERGPVLLDPTRMSTHQWYFDRLYSALSFGWRLVKQYPIAIRYPEGI